MHSVVLHSHCCNADDPQTSEQYCTHVPLHCTITWANNKLSHEHTVKCNHWCTLPFISSTHHTCSPSTYFVMVLEPKQNALCIPKSPQQHLTHPPFHLDHVPCTSHFHRSITSTYKYFSWTVHCRDASAPYFYCQKSTGSVPQRNMFHTVQQLHEK